jgi:hypothetical protein
MHFNKESMARHSVSDRELLEALADPFLTTIEEGLSDRCNPQVLVVGSTATHRLLKLAIKYYTDQDFVFHT